MRYYKYLQIGSIGAIDISSTDSQTLDFIVIEVKKLIPGCRAETYLHSLHIRLDKLQSRDEEVLWRIMEFLCKQGWEPFANHIHFDSVYYDFRQEVLVD